MEKHRHKWEFICKSNNGWCRERWIYWCPECGALKDRGMEYTGHAIIYEYQEAFKTIRRPNQC